MEIKDLINFDLGFNVLNYNERDCILYAISVGATTNDLDLVYEKNLRALPTYACALGLWAVEKAGMLGAYNPNHSLHASQKLIMHAPMPVKGPIESEAKIKNVFDKGKASLLEIEVTSDIFTATYSIFLPGTGGWGGDRGPSNVTSDEPEFAWSRSFQTDIEQATLYRLTGDKHPIHIDASVAKENGFDKPILHGLCTLGITARELAIVSVAHPADLVEIEARLAAPVMPGDTIEFNGSVAIDYFMHFEAKVDENTVLKSGQIKFS